MFSFYIISVAKTFYFLGVALTTALSKTVAIVGCTHAGTFAAQAILTAHPDWTVHVFERNDMLSFLSCGIALWVGGHVSDPNRMFYSSPATLAKNFDAPITDQLANVDLFFQPNFCQPVNFIGAVAIQAVAEQNASDAE